MKPKHENSKHHNTYATRLSYLRNATVSSTRFKESDATIPPPEPLKLRRSSFTRTTEGPFLLSSSRRAYASAEESMLLPDVEMLS